MDDRTAHLRAADTLAAEIANQCEACGARVSHYPSGCPGCGAPQCCQPCCTIANLRAEIATWKAEAKRLRDAKPQRPEGSVEPAGIDQIIEYLEYHRWTHTDWATWFEANPNDPRAKGERRRQVPS